MNRPRANNARSDRTSSASQFGIASGATVVFLYGAVVAAAIRAMYAQFHHLDSEIFGRPVLRSVWHTAHPLDVEGIVALAALHLGVAAALFIATALGASDRLPPALEDRMIATHWLASGVGLLGVVGFFLLIPDAIQSDAPPAMLAVCVATAVISAVMTAINGPRATELERWASAEEAKIEQVRATISRLQLNGIRLSPRRGRFLHRVLVWMRTPDEDADTHVRMLESINWLAVTVPVAAGVLGSVAVGFISDRAIGLLILTFFLIAQAFAVGITVSTANTTLVHERRGRWYPVGVSFFCILMPDILVLTGNLAAVDLATTWLDVWIIVGVTIIELALVWWVYRRIAYSPIWILGALMIVEQRAVRAEERNLARAERHGTAR